MVGVTLAQCLRGCGRVTKFAGISHHQNTCTYDAGENGGGDAGDDEGVPARPLPPQFAPEGITAEPVFTLPATAEQHESDLFERV